VPPIEGSPSSQVMELVRAGLSIVLIECQEKDRKGQALCHSSYWALLQRSVGPTIPGRIAVTGALGRGPACPVVISSRSRLTETRWAHYGCRETPTC